MTPMNSRSPTSTPTNRSPRSTLNIESNSMNGSNDIIMIHKLERRDTLEDFFDLSLTNFLSLMALFFVAGKW